MRRIIVHVDGFVLRGIRPENENAVSTGFRDELSRILAAPGMSRRLVASGNVSRLRIDDVRVTADAEPLQLGAAVARGIGRGLGELSSAEIP